MWAVLSWYLVVQLVGLAALPIAVRLFGRLPDRGFTFARPIGLLLVGYLLWQGAMFGVIGNNRGGIVLTVALVGVLAWLFRGETVDVLRDMWRTRRWMILGPEIVFVAGFLFWSLVRAHIPEVSGTEKPMELMFLNGVLRSERFPPVDPWLAGYSISYYYFGYVIVAFLTVLASVPASVAFNLAIAMLFGLTASCAWGLGGNLAAGSSEVVNAARTLYARRAYLVGAAGGLVLVVFLANLEPVFELLNAHQMISPEFRNWLNIKDMPPGYASRSFFPSDAQDNWWWFRATRVIGDPQSKLDYTINEFPFFSFILGDMHPHVLALPFVITAVAFALNLARSSLTLADLRRQPAFLVAVALLYGGLSFLNAWDMLTYLFILTGAFLIQRTLANGKLERLVLRDTFLFGFIALGVSLLAYFDFYAFFRSQTNGIDSPLFKIGMHTQWHHFLLFWGPLYFVTTSFLAFTLRTSAPQSAIATPDWTRQGVTWLTTVAVAGVLIMLDRPAIGLTIIPLVMVAAAASRMITNAPRAVAPTVTPPAVAARRARTREPIEIAGGSIPILWAREHLFAFLLIGVGMLLILGCELVFIGDSFGNRMNTVFKLYYQAWLLLALGGAFGMYVMWDRWLSSRIWDLPRVAWLTAGVVLLAMALVYPVGSTLSRTRNFGNEMTLDSLAFLERSRGDDVAIFRWLNQNVEGTPTIVEATGGSYSYFGRVAMATGLPTLLGWDFHELQWRGQFDEPGKRKPDIEKIYRSTNVNEVRALLTKYNVTYVIVGAVEREQFGKDPGALDKFANFMDVAYKAPGGSIIYRTRGQ